MTLLVRLFVCSLVCLCCRWCVHLFVRSPVSVFVLSFVDSFVCFFVSSSVCAFLCTFFRSVVKQFVCLLVCSFTRSVVSCSLLDRKFFSLVRILLWFLIYSFVGSLACSFVR